MSPSGGTRASGLLAAALLAIALRAGAGHQAHRPGGTPSPTCPIPRESVSLGDHTTRARCDGRGVGPIRGPARLLFGLPIDLNRADAATLAALPGIGPGRAEAIVRTRMLGPFRSVSDLARVPGIGGGTITRVAQRVVAYPMETRSNPEKTHGLSPDGR